MSMSYFLKYAHNTIVSFVLRLFRMTETDELIGSVFETRMDKVSVYAAVRRGCGCVIISVGRSALSIERNQNSPRSTTRLRNMLSTHSRRTTSPNRLSNASCRNGSKGRPQRRSSTLPCHLMLIGSNQP